MLDISDLSMIYPMDEGDVAVLELADDAVASGKAQKKGGLFGLFKK